jgi:hypothetical protein
VKNPLATVTSPAHAVGKAGVELYRFTVDCRAIKACAVPIAPCVPNMGTMLAGLESGSSSYRVMAVLGFPQAFWQIPLPEESRAISVCRLSWERRRQLACYKAHRTPQSMFMAP